MEGQVDTAAAATVWEAALAATWHGAPSGSTAMSPRRTCWSKGRLCAVIDFGCSSVGDPACDLTIAWTFLSGESREAFYAALPADRATWERAHGWALWKGLITLANPIKTNPVEAAIARHVIEEVLVDRLSI